MDQIKKLVALWQNEPDPKKKAHMKSVLENTIHRLSQLKREV